MQTASPAVPQPHRDRLLRLPELELLTALKKSTIYALMRKGEFPRCLHLTSRCTAWSEADVLKWVEERKAQAALPPSATRGIAPGVIGHRLI